MSVHVEQRYYNFVLYFQEDSSQCAQALARLPSIQMINLQKEISTKNKALHKVKLDINQHTLEKETSTFTHLGVIGEYFFFCKGTCSYISN